MQFVLHVWHMYYILKIDEILLFASSVNDIRFAFDLKCEGSEASIALETIIGIKKHDWQEVWEMGSYCVCRGC